MSKRRPTPTGPNRHGGGRKPRHPDILTIREERFVAEYMKDLHQAHAARRAGITAKDVAAVASRIMALPKVQRAIAARQAVHLAVVDMEAQDVLRGLMRIASSDLRQAFDEFGHLRPIKDMPDGLALALAGIEVEQGKIAGQRVVKIKTCDKLGALNTLAKHFQLLNDKMDVTGDITYRVVWDDDEPVTPPG
ncbi:MAG: terminase small subunit [Acidobacteria bacterium]|nr:terminase small subunit [Acidobacteriota bacterium]